MSLNKKRMVREIGRRTRLKNADVQQVLETLIDVWTEELVRGGRVELEHFVVLTLVDSTTGKRRLKLRVSRQLNRRLRAGASRAD